MQTTSIKNLGNGHSEWKRSLGFFKDELGIYKSRLTEIAGRNTGKETMQMIEHFQNSFLVQQENIDVLHHDINKHLNEMAGRMQEHAGHITKEQVEEYETLKGRFESEALVYNGLKQEFTRFLTQTL